MTQSMQTMQVPAPGTLQRRAMIASGFGWGLDSFDFYLYVYGLPAIVTTFGLTKAAGGLLATYTLAASALGGIVMGSLADRIGRKNTLMLSIAWYAVFTFLSGLAQNYNQLAFFRVCEGIGFGGEWAVGSVLMSEWSDADKRGRNLGFVQGSWALGWLAANFAFQIVFSTVGPNPGWRYLFFLGIVPALFVLYIRRNVSDPPIFEAARAASTGRFSLPGIFGGAIGRTTLFASLLAIGVQSGYYALFTWMPTYLTTQRHISAVTSGSYLYLLIGGAFAGYVTAGYINDALGRRKTFIIFSLCSAAIVPLYLFFVIADWQLLVAGPLLGYFASGIFSGFGPYLSELYPSTVRGAGQGFCYNVGRGVAGIGPFAIGFLSTKFAIGSAMTCVAVAAYLLAVVAVLFLPETRGEELAAE
ncbi:MAG: MFS transporter [Candidatus Eremiobacteraeota bacterium]|nr:MFS transporter [Candidatus Eremiobacteraeota bacterium]